MSQNIQSAGKLPSWLAPVALTLVIGMGVYLLISPAAQAEEFLPPGVTSEQAAIEHIVADAGLSNDTAIMITKGKPIDGITLYIDDSPPVASAGEAVLSLPVDTPPGIVAQAIQAVQDWGYSVTVHLHDIFDSETVTEAPPVEPAVTTETSG